jgi:hypothetical protein
MRFLVVALETRKILRRRWINLIPLRKLAIATAGRAWIFKVDLGMHGRWRQQMAGPKVSVRSRVRDVDWHG